MNKKTTKLMATALTATMGAGMATQLVQAAEVTPYEAALEAVITMEKDPSGANIDKAYNAVVALKAGAQKDALYKRVEAVAGPHHKAVYDLMVTARANKDLKTIGDARKAVAGMAKIFINDAYTWSSELDTFTIEYQKTVVDTLNAIVDGKEEVKQATINELREVIVGLELQRSNEGLLKLVLDYSATLDKVQMDYVDEVLAEVKAAKTTEELKAAKAKYNDLLTVKDEALKAAIVDNIGKAIEVKETQLAEVTIVSATVVDTNKVKVEFSKAVDVKAAKIELKQGSATRYTTAKWSEDGLSVVLQAPSTIAAGTYNVVLSGVTEKPATAEVKVTAEAFKDLVINPTQIVVGDENAKVTFVARNQYNTDMKVAGSAVTVTAYNVTQGKKLDVKNQDLTKSEFTFDLKTADAKVNDEIRVVVSYKGYTVTETLTVVKAATYADLSLGQAVLPEKAVRFQPGQNGVKVPVSIVDTNGQKVKLTEAMMTNNMITIVSSDATKADINAAKVDADGNLLVDLKAAGNVVFTAIINGQAGLVSTTSINIEKTPAVEAVSISSPTKLVAAGDEVKLDVAAVDQYGDKIELTGVKFEYKIGNGDVKSATVVDGKITISPDAAGELTLTATVSDKVLGKVSFTVEEAAQPTAIVGVDVVELYENGATDTLSLDDIKVVDQYGRNFTLTNAAQVTIAPKDETADSVTITDSGSDKVFTGTANTANEVITFTLANKASFDVTLASVKAEDVKSYELKALPTLKADANAKYHGTLELTGKTSAGKVVALVNNKITNITTSNAAVADISAGKVEGKSKGTAVVAVWNGITKLAETTVTVSDAVSVVTSVAFDSSFEKASKAAGEIELADKIVIKDQYGVKLDTVDGIFTTSDSNVASIAGSKLTGKEPGKVTIGYVSKNGLVVTKVINVVE